MKSFLLVIFLLFGKIIFSQEFSKLELSSILKLKTNLTEHFSITDIDSVAVINTKGLIYIPNALRSANFINTEVWLSIKDSVEVLAVDIVFSKYPIKNGKYQMYYPLLQKRLINLFLLDSTLNTNTVQWGLVRQTNCNSDDEANTLFHGVRIYYEKKENINIDQQQDNQQTIAEIQENKAIIASFSSQNGVETLEDNLKNIEKTLPDNIKTKLDGKSLNEKIDITVDYYTFLLDSLPEMDPSKIDENYLKQHKTVIKEFMRRYKGSSNVVTEVLDRNPQWKKTLVIADWTGSMYGYGSQVLLWHINHFSTSGITYFTLFNDGDRKVIKDIGKTEGIYFERANNVDRVIALYNLVQTKGGGGDGPENDIEAILSGMKKYPSHKDIILIADNYACVRDMELANLIGKPVRIILCGYDPSVGINPQYIELAKITKGSIHTIEDDILSTEIDKDMKTKKLKIFNSCETSFLKCTSLESSKQHKLIVKDLLLSNQNINRIPLNIGRYKRLVTLDLSSNQIKQLGNSLDKLTVLQNLDLSLNHIKSFDRSLYKMKYLKTLNLSHNKLKTIKGLLYYAHLETLDLSHNNITYINRLDCYHLNNLNLSYNQLTIIPKGTRDLKNIKVLNLSNNPLKEINSDLKYLKQLKELDLSNCELTTVLKYLRKLRKLQKLDISGNNISDKELSRLKRALPKTNIIF